MVDPLLRAVRRFLSPILLAGIVSFGSPVQASDEFLPRSNPKVQQAEQVYRRVVQAIGDARTPPEFKMVRGKSSAFDVAMFAPSQHRVIMEERFYDLAQRLPASNAPHALALILGHELAHFYRNHSWAMEFGRAFAERQTGAAVSHGAAGVGGAQAAAAAPAERRRVEAEADYFGGFYSLLAGYRPLSVAPQVFDAVYKEYRFDEALPAYEHLMRRKEAAREAQLKLQELMPLFDVGVQLTAIKDYVTAARIFERIAADFPGPEMLNNAGAALANESLRWFPESERRFRYPLEFDPDTRLAEEGQRGAEELDEPERLERRTALLERAKSLFERALAAEPSYATAAVNLACVLDLLGEPDLAAQRAEALLATKAREDGTAAQALVIAGIAAVHRDRLEEARKAFTEARALGHASAEDNLAVLAGRDVERGTGSSADAPRPIQPETVGGTNIADVNATEVLAEQDSKTIGRWEADEERPDVRIVTRTRGGVRTTVVMRGSAGKRVAVVFLSAERDALGKTGRGVTAGMPVPQLEAAYGLPAVVLTARKGLYYRYENPYRGSQVGLLVRIDANRSVREWVAYRIEE
ncbi:conserved exported protein of unknown function [Nitrospira japonica]|uniref:Peptidase M48 domain-containing protein n=1 Tax=Nitrospira japonica TaxID=1325564 RepID=A0A1W1I6Q5_9BACT|nr:M48 family metalloprotease [Nitrospira japonica]SLM48674.1 conserved exported protein of unknown function [Nitrospira japonica]